jgi:hypothetical protein
MGRTNKNPLRRGGSIGHCVLVLIYPDSLTSYGMPIAIGIVFFNFSSLSVNGEGEEGEVGVAEQGSNS